MIRLLGPAFVAAVAYIDPGNYATNIQAGARYGYLLMWVVLWSSLIGVLIQLLSAKLGIATRSSLATLIRDRLPRWASIAYWLQAELLAIATDLAEFVGAALGFHLLFGISLLAGAIATGIVSSLRRADRRHLGAGARRQGERAAAHRQPAGDGRPRQPAGHRGLGMDKRRADRGAQRVRAAEHVRDHAVAQRVASSSRRRRSSSAASRSISWPDRSSRLI